jgi:hypothetical protein
MAVYSMRAKFIQCNHDASETRTSIRMACFPREEPYHNSKSRHYKTLSLPFNKYNSIFYRFPMVSLEFFIYIILLAALWPWGRVSL